MTLELKNILYFYTVLKYMYYVDVDLFQTLDQDGNVQP